MPATKVWLTEQFKALLLRYQADRGFGSLSAALAHLLEAGYRAETGEEPPAAHEGPGGWRNDPASLEALKRAAKARRRK